MKNRFESKDIKSFFQELKESDEVRLQGLIQSYTESYLESLVGLYDGDDYESSETLEGSILMAESPIERLFYVAIQKNAIDYGYISGDGQFDITPQYEIKFLNKKYRVDFSISYFNGENRVFEIFVELNGHEYHNASKKKVTADRKRERALQNKCDRVMTFTGSEIFEDADLCALEVIKVLDGFVNGKSGDR